MKSLFCVATGLCLLIGHLSLGCTAARANELPDGTNKIESLTPEQARKLLKARHNDLKLNGLATLDADTARALAEFEGQSLYLNGLTTLDSDTAKTLAGFKGTLLVLGGLTTLDADTAKALAGFEGRGLFLNGLTTLTAEMANVLAESKCRTLVLNGLTTLDAETATALAGHKGGYLFLGGLTTLDAKTTKALLEFKGEELHLGGLPTIDADTAKSLEGFCGYLFLQEKARTKFFADNPLAPNTVLAWAVVSNGDLSTVTAFDTPDSVAVAQALAKHKGPLKLPNLKKISPKTLAALVKKEDVEIPLIETLELIQEPDGSVTEDFVIPEGFQKGRQRQGK